MKRRSVFTKLLIGNLLLVAVIVVVSFGVAYAYLNTAHRERSIRNQRQMTETLQHTFEKAWPSNRARVDELCKELLVDAPMRLTVIAADGQVVGDSRADPITMANHRTPDRPEVLAALAGQDGSDTRASETLGTVFRYTAMPVRHGGQVAAAVRVAMPVTAVAESGSYIVNSLVWAALASLAAAAALGMFLSWAFYAPLREISLAARWIASGKLDANVRVRGRDEIGHLAESLNEMRRGIRSQIELVSAERENLAAVVGNLREGVVALDHDGCIVLMNLAASALLSAGEGNVVGRRLQSVVRNVELLDVLDELGDEETVDRQIELSNGPKRVLDVHAERVAASPPGIALLLVLHDVTEIVQAAAVKAEFVANASHELRTPLATIRAAIESLAAIDPGDREALAKFIAILDRHARRLENLTRDLLDLHIVESRAGGARLKTEDIDVSALAEWAQGYFADAAARKSVTLSLSAEPSEGTFRCDRAMLQLILQNLIDNAIKFTPGGGRVDCLFALRDETVLLRVSDTGCGIEPALQPRVFERFFQVDPARTGGEGKRGTGLGLSIVKHAADRLHATVQLDSEPGRGTTVEVLLPRR